MRAMNAFLEKVHETVRRHRMIDGAERVVLAVSGGPDSLCLLHAMNELRRDCFPKLSLHVGHLHHGMRPDAADADAEFVARAAAELGLPCTVERADVPGIARAKGSGEEAAGREARYAFLCALAERAGAERIATGHNLDDQAETVLMRCMRGAGPRGLGGIPYVRGCGAKGAAQMDSMDGMDRAGILIVRPLLDCSRAEIEEYLTQAGLRWRLDSTNLSPRYLRNRVRRAILPGMAGQFGNDLAERLHLVAGSAQRLQREAKRLADALCSKRRVLPVAGGIETDLAWLRELGPGMRAELVRMLIVSAGLSTRMLGAAHYAAVSALLERGDGETDLPGGVRAVAGAGRFRLLRGAEAAATDAPSRALNVPGVTQLPFAAGRIEADLLEGGLNLLERLDPGSEALFDADCVRGRLEVRPPRPGDRMRPLGAPGTRKLQDIFTELRVPRWRRGTLVLVTEEDVPIWIVGYRTAERGKLAEGTRRVLRLRLVAARGDQEAGPVSASGPAAG